MASFANQRTVTIHKPSYNKNFVQVDIDDWQEAYDSLPKAASACISIAAAIRMTSNSN